MEVVLPLFLGAVSGVIYNEHIYFQSKRSPKMRPLMSFWVRFLVMGMVMLLVAVYLGETALLVFFSSHLLVRMAHTLVRGLKVVRL